MPVGRQSQLKKQVHVSDDDEIENVDSDEEKDEALLVENKRHSVYTPADEVEDCKDDAYSSASENERETADAGASSSIDLIDVKSAPGPGPAAVAVAEIIPIQTPSNSVKPSEREVRPVEPDPSSSAPQSSNQSSSDASAPAETSDESETDQPGLTLAAAKEAHIRELQAKPYPVCTFMSMIKSKVSYECVKPNSLTQSFQ